MGEGTAGHHDRRRIRAPRLVSHALCGRDAREKSDGHRQRVWSRQHHVCAARGQADLCGPGGVEPEGAAAALRNFETSGCGFVPFEDLSSLRPLDADYDVIMAMGSLHHAPAKVMKPEYQELLRHLKIGGRWLQLAYPRSRWIREGRSPFSKWGEMTDGAGTPWCEWYDLPKLLSMFEPAKFEVVLYQEFHNSDFNWFDLVYRGQ